MIKKYLLTFCLFIVMTINLNAAGTSDSSSGTSKVKSDYDKAVTIIKSAKKYEKKGKNEKAIKRYEKAQKLLIKSNKKKPLQADTLNYLGLIMAPMGSLFAQYILIIDPDRVFNIEISIIVHGTFRFTSSNR